MAYALGRHLSALLPRVDRVLDLQFLKLALIVREVKEDLLVVLMSLDEAATHPPALRRTKSRTSLLLPWRRLHRDDCFRQVGDGLKVGALHRVGLLGRLQLVDVELHLVPKLKNSSRVHIGGVEGDGELEPIQLVENPPGPLLHGAIPSFSRGPLVPLGGHGFLGDQPKDVLGD